MSEQTPTAVEVDLVGRLVGGRFRIESRLGGGGMGTVWRAHDLQLSRPCAVKTLHAGLLSDHDAHERFIREARAAAAIGGRHVVGFVAADYDPGDGKTGGFPFLAMDLLQGEDLEHRLLNDGPMPPQRALVVLGQVAKALDRAHGLGIIHRDIKPENIFLASEDDEEVAKVLDFGIAKVTANLSLDRHRLTRSKATMGSPLYIAPEQIVDAAGAMPASDLWSFALVAFRTLSAIDYWDATSLAQLVHQICYDPLPAASVRSGGRIPAAADGWFARALSRDPAGRFGSAGEMVSKLAESLSLSGLPSVPGQAETAAVSLPPAAGVPNQTMQGLVGPVPALTAGTPRPVAARRPARLWLALGLAALVGVGVVAGLLSNRAPATVSAAADPVASLSAPAIPAPGSISLPEASRPASIPTDPPAAPSAAPPSPSLPPTATTSVRSARPGAVPPRPDKTGPTPAPTPSPVKPDDEFGTITRQ